MPKKIDAGIVRTDRQIENKLLEFILGSSSQSKGWWNHNIQGTSLNRSGILMEYRQRYEARRSVSGLGADAKNEPFPLSSNVGVGIEAVFGEWLIAQILGNTVDLEPPLTVEDIGTGKIDDDLTKAHTDFLKNESDYREKNEACLREIFTVGSCITKDEYISKWNQKEIVLTVLLNPLTGQPAFNQDQSGRMQPIVVDPNMPEDKLPFDKLSGQRMKKGQVTNIQLENSFQGPRMRIRPIESIEFPAGTTQSDPEDWDYIFDNYKVSPWWFLAREGRLEQGKIPKERLQAMFKQLGVDLNNVWRNPSGSLTELIDVKEAHLRFPVTTNGRPVEVIAHVVPKFNMLLSWRVSFLSRRPFFNYSLWKRKDHPFGKGIPETVYGPRSAVDAELNQDLDSGNLYNHPPLLLSSLAMLNDEDYEEAGPGTVWTMTDINGAKFLNPPISKRDPLALINWLMSMMQRQWGVTDLVTNAPTESLSPAVDTARGTIAILNQGSVKFGHLTKSYEATRTKELNIIHEMFSVLFSGKRFAEVDGECKEVDREFYRQGVRLKAAGDGVYSNPITRQQTLSQLDNHFVTTQNPFWADPETKFEVTKQIISAFGLRVDLKEPQILQQIQQLQAFAQTPIGQQKIQEGMQILQTQAAIEQAAQGQGGGGQNGNAPERTPDANQGAA